MTSHKHYEPDCCHYVVAAACIRTHFLTFPRGTNIGRQNTKREFEENYEFRLLPINFPLMFVHKIKRVPASKFTE